MPFSNLAGDGPARVVLEQVDDTQFRILVPFKYIDPAGNEYEVPASDLNDPNDVTDLASVPWILRWLVASYGQHTTAALLHDRLVRPGMTLPERVEADTVFFRALEESGNNWMRHRLMWAAVAVGGTMWSHKRKLGLLFFAHVLAFWAAVIWATGALPWIAPLWAGIAAAALLLLGFAWRLASTADPSLSWWMWLAAAVGAALVVPPCVLIAASVRVVQLIDHLVAVIKGAGPQPYERPTPLKPPDLAKAKAREASLRWTAEPPAG